MLSKLQVVTAVAAYVQYDFNIKNGAADTPRISSLLRRSEADLVALNDSVEPILNASLTSGYNFFHGSIFVGQPPQEIEVLLDTGSPVSWVYGPEGSYNNATRFFSNESSTFKLKNDSFSAEYGSGEYLGHWGSDMVSAPQFVKDSIVQDADSQLEVSTGVPFDFGIVSSFATSAGSPGLLGLGPHIEAAGPSDYQSLPEAYAKYNVTSSPAFSMFLDGDKGRFLFGGVDTQFFDFPLYRFHPKSALTGTPSGQDSPVSAGSWEIFLDGATLDNGTDYIVRSNVVLDTGSPVSLLPPGFVDAVGKSLGLSKYDKYETYFVNKTVNATLPEGTVTFNFNGFKIDADISAFLVPGEYIWLDDGPKDVTALAFMGSPNYLLGDGFFRSSYTILDPSSGDVILGQRSVLTLNESKYSNASTVIPLSDLLTNKSAIVNGSALVQSSSLPGAQPGGVTTSPIDGATNTPALVLANQYVGTVPADKAKSLTNNVQTTGTISPTGGISTVSATSKSTVSSSSDSSSSSSPSSSGSKNSASSTRPSLCLILTAALVMGFNACN